LAAEPAITKIQAIRQLDAAEAEREHPVRIRGVVTYFEPAWFLSFIQDESAGIYVSCGDARLAPGDIVEAEGVTSRGRLGRIVLVKSVSGLRVVGHGELPAPREATLEQLQDGRFDAQWVATSAKVESVDLDGDRATLVLAAGTARLRAVLPGYSTREELPMHLAGFPVVARGVLGVGAEQEDGKFATLLCIPSAAEIRIDPEALARHFDARRISDFEALFGAARSKAGELTRVQGRVTFAREGRGFFLNLYVADRIHGTVYVQSTQPGIPALGDVVDAVGHVEKINGRPVLQDAMFRVLGHGDVPGALHVPDADVAKGDFHGHLLWLHGTVVEILPGLAENAWLIRTGFGLVHARLTDSRSPRSTPPVVEPGTVVGVTGILLRNGALPGERAIGNAPATYQALLRDPGDFVVLRPPPWWTVRRIAVALGIAALIAAAASIWVFSLRRRVREQTAIIRRQLEHEALFEERTRIARDLHDTLAQHLAGITIQLDAAAERLRTEDREGRDLLETAREMAAHSMDQTRLAIWDLRSPTLAREGLPAALLETLQPLAEQRAVGLKLEMQGAPRRFGGPAENHVFRIAHEAAANALRHADPRLISITVAFGDENVSVRVADDGCGFDVPALEALPAGHFGLRGMLERSKKLNARLLIESRPGAGSALTVLVPYPAAPRVGFGPIRQYRAA
jgi:signal transduction histidine kinase